MIACSVWLLIQPLHWLLTAQYHWRISVRSDLARSRAKAALLPQLRQWAAKLPKEPIWSRFYQPAAREDAGLLLQQDLVRICAESGVKMESASRLPSHVEGTLLKHGVQLNLSATADRLRSFVEHIRSAPRYLRVERLHIGAPQAQRTEGNPVVSVALEIAGYAVSTNLKADDAHP